MSQATLKLFTVAEADLEFLILVPLFPKCWNYRHVPPWLVYEVLGTEPGISFILGKPYQLSHQIVSKQYFQFVCF